MGGDVASPTLVERGVVRELSPLETAFRVVDLDAVPRPFRRSGERQQAEMGVYVELARTCRAPVGPCCRREQPSCGVRRPAAPER